MSKKKVRDIIRFGILIGLIVVLNMLGSLKFFRLDLTGENRYSLNDVTIDLLDELEDPVLVKVYLEGDFPAGFQRLQAETRQMLDEFRAYSPNIEYIFINPNAAEDREAREDLHTQLQSKGINPYRLEVREEGGRSQRTIFPGAVMSLGDEEISLQLLDNQMGVSSERQVNNSIQNLEFKLANTLRALTQSNKPSIAFLQGHDELGPREIADFARELSQNYKVDLFNIREFKRDTITGEISIARQQRNLNRFDAVIIAKPQRTFNDMDKYLLDQYIMTGGKTIWLIDAVEASMDSLTQKSQFMSLPLYDRLNINDMLFKYGVRVNTNLVGDMMAAGVSDREQVRPWIYFPMVMPRSKHPVVKDINAVWFRFASSLDTVETPASKKTILLESSPYSASFPTPHIVNLGLLYEPPPEKRFTRSGLALATLIEGRFQSVYKNRLAPRDGGEKLEPKAESGQNQMLVVGDGDVVRNQLNIVNQNMSKNAPLPLGYDQYTGQRYGNSDFLMNAVDYMLDESGLISLRSRELKIRMLDRSRVGQERLLWQVVNTGVPIVLVLLFGLLYHYFRKRKYTA